jgi:hypothetical protein
MNIKLPTPSEMPTRLFDLMVQRFQMELFNGFSAPDTALNSWFTEKLDGRTVLRASFTFDYDIAVEGEHLPKVMELMLQTVRGAGWFAEVHSATLDVCEIDFSELGDSEDEEDDEDERDPDDFDPAHDAGVMLSLDRHGEVEPPAEHSANVDADDEDDSETQFRDDSETELEFEDEDDSEDDDAEDDSVDSDDDEVSEPKPAPTGTRILVEAISEFGDAISAGAIDWTDIVELDATTVVLELMRDGKELEIEVAAKFDEASETQDVVFHVTPSEKPTLHFASLSALMAYLKEVYGDATKT